MRSWGTATIRLFLLFAFIAAVLLVVVWPALPLGRGPWTRDNPLIGAVAVTAIKDGAITLADGRCFRPAAVRQRANVSAAEYDAALRAITNQGVVVVRDLGDGSALLLAEPKFYNWCGNSAPHWAGSYYQCPVTDLLVRTAYADPWLDQPGLTARERCRLEGLGSLFHIEDTPIELSRDGTAFRLEGDERHLIDYEGMLETFGKVPPPPE